MSPPSARCVRRTSSPVFKRGGAGPRGAPTEQRCQPGCPAPPIPTGGGVGQHLRQPPCWLGSAGAPHVIHQRTLPDRWSQRAHVGHGVVARWAHNSRSAAAGQGGGPKDADGTATPVQTRLAAAACQRLEVSRPLREEAPTGSRPGGRPARSLVDGFDSPWAENLVLSGAQPATDFTAGQDDHISAKWPLTDGVPAARTASDALTPQSAISRRHHR